MEVPALPPEHYEQFAGGETSSVVRERTCAARARMLERQGKDNAQLSVAEVEEFCAPVADGIILLRRAVSRLGISARGYHRILKVARTIADIGGTPNISAEHVAEAIQFRRVGNT